MKLLAISDTYIPASFMRAGFASLTEVGIDVAVRSWEHASLIELQEANLAIEQGGPEAVALPDQLFENLETFDFLCVQFCPVSQRMIDEAKRLKAIGVLRGGTENVEVALATSRGIAVLNTPGRNARAVAECTLGLILSEVRNIARSHTMLKQGIWSREYPNKAAIPELCEKTVGLVGYGSVAQLVAGYLAALGSRVIAFDPYFQGEATATELVDLETLLRQSDVVSLHARLTEESRHLIGAEQLRLMKPTAILVNTARSGLVDEAALVAALQERQITGAALDVFDTEPLPPDHPLIALDNVTIVPHIAGSTIDAFRNSPKMMAGHLRRMIEGRRPLPIVNQVEPSVFQGREAPG